MPDEVESLGLYSGKALRDWAGDVSRFLRLWGPLLIVSGVAGGLGAVVFRALILLNEAFFFGLLMGHGIPLIFLPVLGALIVGPVIYKFASEAWGHGVPEVMEALRTRGGRIRRRVAFVKILASSVTIGSGGSAGREGPIAQIGASVSSIVGQWLRMDERSLRLLVMAGASAGISGTFKAPIGGALFGLEVLHGEIRTTDLVVMALSSIVGYGVSIALLGTSPIFLAQNITYSDIDLPFFFLLGILGGLAAYLWTRSLYGVEDLFAKVKAQRQWFSPFLGAWVVGGVGMLLPETLGLGYTVMNSLFARTLTVAFIGSLAVLFALLFVGKLATSVFTIGSGGSGGVFSPSLFLGAMLGALFGLLVAWLFPSLSIDYLTFALVGMGVVFAGAAKAPLMSTMIVAEMCRNFTLLPGLFVGCVTAYLISGPGSIYLFKVQRTVGQRIPDRYLAVPKAPAMAVLVYKALHPTGEPAPRRRPWYRRRPPRDAPRDR